MANSEYFPSQPSQRRGPMPGKPMQHSTSPSLSDMNGVLVVTGWQPAPCLLLAEDITPSSSAYARRKETNSGKEEADAVRLRRAR